MGNAGNRTAAPGTIGWAAVAVGVAAVVAALVASTSGVGRGFAFGFGAFIVFFGVLAVAARNRAPDYWGLFTVGLAMVIVPFIGSGYAADLGASWTCWAAGGSAMVLGGVGWVGSRTPTEYGIHEAGGQPTKRPAESYWLGRVALVVALAAVLLGIAVHSTPAGVAVTIGLGAMTAVLAVWSLLAVDPTHDFLTMAVTGFALFLSPWVAGFAGGNAAWTTWIAGAIIATTGVFGYLRGERLDFGNTVERDATAQYREQHRHS